MVCHCYELDLGYKYQQHPLIQGLLFLLLDRHQGLNEQNHESQELRLLGIRKSLISHGRPFRLSRLILGHQQGQSYLRRRRCKEHRLDVQVRCVHEFVA